MSEIKCEAGHAARAVHCSGMANFLPFRMTSQQSKKKRTVLWHIATNQALSEILLGRLS